MEYLVRLVQMHQSFRRAELHSLAALEDVDLEIVAYDDSTPFCIIRLESEADARKLISRSILSYGIYELWAGGVDYTELHAAVKGMKHVDVTEYREASFRFELDCFRGKRSTSKQREIMETFDYLPLDGPILMTNPRLHLCVFEFFQPKGTMPEQIYLGRWIAGGAREAINKYDLKKRRYIARTSMDAELSLVTANLTLAAPAKIIYDPFVGTGSFSVTCAHFGAMALGSDIDGRSIRGDGTADLKSNFEQYQIESCLLDSFIADLTNSPMRKSRWIDGIICDPPYGIREGPKVLGYHDGRKADEVVIQGTPAHVRPGYIPPKRQYDFDEMMADILDFGYEMLVDNGRISMWMPTANDEDMEVPVPSHPGLELLSDCIQTFNKWSRRLLTYRRSPGLVVEDNSLPKRIRKTAGKADQLNRFRKKYFEGFKSHEMELESKLG